MGGTAAISAAGCTPTAGYVPLGLGAEGPGRADSLSLLLAQELEGGPEPSEPSAPPGPRGPDLLAADLAGDILAALRCVDVEAAHSGYNPLMVPGEGMYADSPLKASGHDRPGAQPLLEERSLAVRGTGSLRHQTSSALDRISDEDLARAQLQAALAQQELEVRALARQQG